jgi:hypothetical protein
VKEGNEHVREGVDTVPAGAQDAPWRHYPHLDAAIEMANPPVIEGIERTWSEIVRTSQSGALRDQERARTVLTAYGRTMELYRRLVELRDHPQRAGGSNMRIGAPIKQ